MTIAGARRGDWVHFALMIAAFGLAYAVPFELLILARAVLGPIHYATEISWLHDRRYYLKRRDLAAALAVVAVGAAFINNTSWFGFAIWTAFVLSAASAATRSSTQRDAFLMAAAGLTVIVFVRWPALAVMGGLLTTFVHASLFTLIFMVLGAQQAQSRAQAALVAAYIAIIGLMVVFPPSETPGITAFADVAHKYFDGIGEPLGMLFGTGHISLDRLIGLLAFIYTYHYLNWFIKAEVIRWTNISVMRWITIGIVSAASIALYFFDFALGFSVVLALSLMHVVLEFPLDALAVRQLGEAIAGSLFANRSAVRR